MLGAATVGAALAAVSYVAVKSYWRPVVPGIVIEAQGREALGGSNQLMVIYGERGGDPRHSGGLLPDQRLSGCVFYKDQCQAGPARHELHLVGSRKQSLQVRNLNGEGNPIVATVVWTGPAYPAAVRLACDFRNPRLDQACAKVS